MPSCVKVEYHPEAQEEFLAAVRCYAAEDRSLAVAFRDAVQRAERQIASAPLRWAPYLRPTTRRFLLKRFPFALIYTTTRRRVHVLAVAHQRRRPGYWLERLAT